MNTKDLKNISKLSGIKMSEDELASLEADLEKIRAMADAMAELDLGDATASDGVSVSELRADVPQKAFEHQGLTDAAPLCEDGYVKTVSVKGDGL